MTKKILIVDDEDDIRLAVRMLLESEGYEVSDASGGKKALDFLKNNAVDLVIIDFFMPIINGRQVIEKIRNDAKLKNLKIILLTVATFGKEGEEKLKELQVSAYIQKPFDNKVLLLKLKKLLK